MYGSWGDELHEFSLTPHAFYPDDKTVTQQKSVKAAIVHSFNQPLVIEDVPKPTPGPGEIVVKIEASGLCHTDIHAAHGDWPVKPKLPLIPGHEGIGIVEEVGKGVTEVKSGDRVGSVAGLCVRLL